MKRIKSSDGGNRGDRGDNTSYTIPCSFAYKVVCVDDKFSKPVVLYRGKNAVYRFIDAILGEYNYCRRVTKNHFNKNLVTSTENEERFQLSNKCWICDKLVDVEIIK